MMLVILFLKILFLPGRFVHGILGGTEIDIDETPYQINYADICGGVLIHKRWAVTTAHCGKENYIRIGNRYRLGGPQIKIDKHIIHPNYGKEHSFDYDIQLLRLLRKLRVNDFVQPIRISNGIFGDHIYVAGWGYTKEKGEFQPFLKQVKLPIVRFWRCQRVPKKWYNNTLTQRMFCAGGAKEADACQGDSGSAAVSLGKLVGISSFGYGCGRNYPGVYVNLTEMTLRGWIRNHTGV